MSKRVTLNNLISYALTCNEYVDSDDYNQDNSSFDNSHDDEYDLTVNNNMEKNVFKQLISGESNSITDLPKNLKAMFDPFIKDVIRQGILNKHVSNDISLLFSILYCTCDNFLEFSGYKQLQTVKNFNKRLFSGVFGKSKLFEKFEYKEKGWTKKELKNALSSYKNNKMVLQVLSDYFNINIFLLNVSEDKLYAIYSEELFNMFKMNVFISHNDGIFEPLCYNDKKLWKYDDEPLKKLINVEKQKINVMDVSFLNNNEERLFQAGSEDLNKYLNLEEKETIKDDDDDARCKGGKGGNESNESDEDNDYDELFSENKESSQHDDIYINDPEETEIDVESVKHAKDIFCTQDEVKAKKLGKKKKSKKSKKDYSDLEGLNTRMTVASLQKLAEKYHIDIENGNTATGKIKYKTKQDLYDELIAIKN